ncbi:DUF5979 domain-containing protein [Prescottella defluvii]|nr:DUF5979 domain-containing protein [Prescottella defluvii]
MTNFVDTNDGTLRIAKQVSGEAAGAVGDDVEFTVQARWRDGTNYATKDLIVKKGVATPLGVDLPVGTEVTFTETGRPDVAGVEWGTISSGHRPARGIVARHESRRYRDGHRLRRPDRGPFDHPDERGTVEERLGRVYEVHLRRRQPDPRHRG